LLPSDYGVFFLENQSACAGRKKIVVVAVESGPS